MTSSGMGCIFGCHDNGDEICPRTSLRHRTPLVMPWCRATIPAEAKEQIRVVTILWKTDYRAKLAMISTGHPVEGAPIDKHHQTDPSVTREKADRQGSGAKGLLILNLGVSFSLPDPLRRTQLLGSRIGDERRPGRRTPKGSQQILALHRTYVERNYHRAGWTPGMGSKCLPPGNRDTSAGPGIPCFVPAGPCSLARPRLLCFVMVVRKTGSPDVSRTFPVSYPCPSDHRQ